MFRTNYLDDTTSIAVQMPDKEPKEAAKKAKVKAVSAVKVKRYRYPTHEPPIAMRKPLASHTQSPVALPSPMELTSVPQPKQEPLFNFNRLGLHADRTPDYAQDDSHYLSSLQGRSASSTEQASFSSAEVESMPRRAFGAQGPLQSPYIVPYGHEGVQNMSFIPMSLPENAYAVTAPEVMKQPPAQHVTFNQTPMQDFTYTSPTFAQSVRDPTGWYSTPASVTQQPVGWLTSVPYTPSVRSTQHLAPSVSNEVAPSITGIPYISESRYLPTQAQYNPYSGGVPDVTHHGLPGYNNTNMNARNYY